jgi:hypothetical protein
MFSSPRLLVLLFPRTCSIIVLRMIHEARKTQNLAGLCCAAALLAASVPPSRPLLQVDHLISTEDRETTRSQNVLPWGAPFTRARLFKGPR